MKSALALALGLLAACVPLHPRPGPLVEASGGPRASVEETLDAFHRAAARADGPRYFGRMAEGGIFLGTDASERWDRAAFEAWAEPYFSRGQGWDFEPRERHVYIEGEVAWFDERLWNEKYGETRGTGVLRRRGTTWRIVQYNLSFPVPNELATEVVERIRSLESPPR